MASIEEIRNARLSKLKTLTDAGENAYPISTKRDTTLADASVSYTKLSKKKSVTLVGRVMSLRPQGGLIFFTLDDGTGRFQGLIKSDEVAPEVFDLFSKT